MDRCDDREDRLDELTTVRDWLRYAVSRFREAGLVYGHGTADALDEAAFLILETLSLPVDRLEPWLEARLTRTERRALAAVVDRRIATRKPAPYVVGAAWIGPHRFRVDERIIVPRSYIGELLVSGGLASILPEPDAVRRVLDLCTGGGSLAILAALAFPEATIDAVDVSADALEVARANVEDYGLCGRVTLLQSDLFAAVAGRRYDLVLSNPPYVRDAAVAAFPPEYAAEPRLAHAGGADGLDVVRRILAAAGGHLVPGGHLVVEVGRERETVETEWPGLPFLWLDTTESEGEVLAIPAAALATKPAVRRRKR